MCGIAGFLGFEDKHLIKQMCDIQIHRGPDDEGTFIDKNICLGHRRLSIIDLDTGKQPIYNEDESIVVVYNGEIYNFKELRLQLESKGHRFYTATDTEVIVHAYEEYGCDCVKLFNGMFAVALWDIKKQILFLARDRAGIKPLHYTFLNDGTFIFASEIKAILQYAKVKRNVDIQALHEFINLRYVPQERTMFKDIKRLLPAHYMVVQFNSDSHAIINRYWQPQIINSNKSEDYYAKKLCKLLSNAVKNHMISDVPIGITLSGGIDSGTIVAFASQNTDEQIKTFCMGFGLDNDETNDARIVSEHFNTDHLEFIRDSNILSDLQKMIWYADEPKRNLYPYYVADQVKNHVKVALGGLGGDELFAGYTFKYDYINKIERIRQNTTPNWYKAHAHELLRFQSFDGGDIVDDDHMDYLEMIKNINYNAEQYLICQTQDKVWNPHYQNQIYGNRVLKYPQVQIKSIYEPMFKTGDTFLNQVQLADFSIKLPDDFLFVDDRMNMANSIESRVPFLDNELIDFAFSIPIELKYNKRILKLALKDTLPKEVLNKEKQGFASSTYDTYRKELRDMALDMLPEGNLVKDGFFKKSYIDKVLNAIPNPRLTLHYNVIWNMVAFETWYNMFILGDMKCHV